MVNTLRPRWSLPVREVEEVFDHFFGGVPGGNGNGETASPATAPASLWEEEGRFVVEFDLPGVKLEDIDITFEKNALRVAAERHAPECDRKYWHQERTYGKAQRLITLPETVDPNSIEAELKDGVLRLSMAKRPELQPKKIQVKAS